VFIFTSEASSANRNLGEPDLLNRTVGKSACRRGEFDDFVNSPDPLGVSAVEQEA
jgi:hypothetical protein